MKLRKNKQNFLLWLFLWIKRVIVVIISGWFLAILIFKFIPIPYSSIMFDRQVSAWLTNDSHYQAHKTWVSADNIAPNMYLAVIAGEDQKFLSHWGLDFDAIKSALTHNDKNMTNIRGASTISQQMIKNLFLWDGRSWLRKGLEAGLTLGTEAIWSKKRILTVYLNIVEFGDGIFGVEAAANTFFHKSAKELTLSETALLAAVLPNPHIFKVNTPSDYVKERQKWIIKQMEQLGGLNLLKDL